MFMDLVFLLKRIRPQQGTMAWAMATRLLGPRLSSMVDGLSCAHSGLRAGICRVFQLGPPRQAHRYDVAVACVAAHAILARFAALLQAIDRFRAAGYLSWAHASFLEDWPSSCGAPRDLLGALIEALHKPNPRRELLQLVVREAASRLGKCEADRMVQGRARRQLSQFFALAQEAANQVEGSPTSGSRERSRPVVDISRLIEEDYPVAQIRERLDWLERTRTQPRQDRCLQAGYAIWSWVAVLPFRAARTLRRCVVTPGRPQRVRRWLGDAQPSSN